MKRILILGGTQFLGRCFIERLLASAAPYEIFLFNRGKTNADLFPEIQRIQGDRETADIEKVVNRDWDYVIDFSAYYPDSLRGFLQKSAGRIGRLIFTSTVSVYAIEQSLEVALDENAPLWNCSKEQRTDTSMLTYGQRKVACEQEILEQVGGGALDAVILRPSVVFGKYDHINRHLYWLHRIEHQSRILLPENGKQTDNYTFVEDYAELLLRTMQAEKHRTIYNASTQPVNTLRYWLEGAAKYMGKNPEWISRSAEQLKQMGIGSNERISLWFGGWNVGFNPDKAVADFGDFYHSIHDGVAKTIDYYRSIGWAGMENVEKRYLTEAHEQELLIDN